MAQVRDLAALQAARGMAWRGVAEGGGAAPAAEKRGREGAPVRLHSADSTVRRTPRVGEARSPMPAAALIAVGGRRRGR